jgi:hypothetical protein
MAKNIFCLLLQWDRDLHQRSEHSLDGKEMLCSDSEWINHYFCSLSHDKIPLFCHAEQSAEEISTNIWKGFVPFLYGKMEKSSFHKIIAHITDFLIHLTEQQQLEASQLQIIVGAIKSEAKGIERIFKVHQHFSSRQRSWVYQAKPTETLDSIDWNQSFAEMQEPDRESRISDTFRLVSLNPEEQLGYFKGEKSQLSVVVKLDEKCCKILCGGDLIPMVLFPSSSGMYFLFSTGHPILHG